MVCGSSRAWRRSRVVPEVMLIPSSYRFRRSRVEDNCESRRSRRAGTSRTESLCKARRRQRSLRTYMAWLSYTMLRRMSMWNAGMEGRRRFSASSSRWRALSGADMYMLRMYFSVSRLSGTVLAPEARVGVKAGKMHANTRMEMRK